MDYPIPTPEEQHKGPDLRQQHYNGDAGRELPRDGEPKKSSFVQWEDSSTTTSRDQVKNNMTPEPCLEEKTMRKSGGESQVKIQTGFSNNVGGSAKAKTGMLSNDRKEDGKTAGVQSKNVADPLSRPHQLFQGENSTASPTIPSDDEKDEKGHENATFDINVDPQTTPSNGKEMKELLNVEHKDNSGTQASDLSKRNATEEGQTSYRQGESSTTSPNNSPKIAPHDQEKEHEDDGTKSHPDPSKPIANGFEGIKNVEPPYLPPQSEGGCSPCCPPCSIL